MLDRKPADRTWPDLAQCCSTRSTPVARQFEASGEAFCRLFPNRFYFVDDTRGLSAGFHLIEGFFRDDQPLCNSC